MKKLLLALPVLASAAGFQILEQSATYLGQAYAGTAASVENASATYYNPAGITENKGWKFSLSTCLLSPNTKFTLTDATTTTGTDLLGGAVSKDYEAKHNLIPVPQFFMTKDYGDNFAFGFSVNSPYGLKSEYDNDANSPIRFWATKSSLTTVNFSATGAYKMTKNVSIGVGPDFSLGYLYLSKMVAAPALALLEQPLHGNAWGWHAGLFYKSAQFDAGFRYNSMFEYNLSGDALANGQEKIGGAALGSITSTVRAPEVYVLSLNYHLNDKNNILVDLQSTNWERVKDIDVAFGPGILQGLLTQAHNHAPALAPSATDAITPMNYKQAWRGALGYQYLLSQSSTLRLGLAFDGSPANDTDRIPGVPDAGRTWYSIGYTQKWGGSTLDFGYSFVKIRDAKINLTDLTGHLAGTWKSHVHILGIQWNTEWN